MTILNMEFCGVMKVISGGQCGVDRAGLEVARQFNLQTGGTAPKGWRTWYGPAPELGSEFGLVEHWSENYQHRTRQNVKDSDATLILASNADSAGTALTANLCKLYGKKVILVDLKAPDEFDAQVSNVAKWIKDNCVTVLNVAGNRDTGTGELATLNFDRACMFLCALFSLLQSQNLLVTPLHK